MLPSCRVRSSSRSIKPVEDASAGEAMAWQSACLWTTASANRKKVSFLAELTFLFAQFPAHLEKRAGDELQGNAHIAEAKPISPDEI